MKNTSSHHSAAKSIHLNMGVIIPLLSFLEVTINIFKQARERRIPILDNNIQNKITLDFDLKHKIIKYYSLIVGLF